MSRSSSLAAMAMAASGVASSWAAPAASVTSEASLARCSARRRSRVSSSSRLASARLTRCTMRTMTKAATATATSIPYRCTAIMASWSWTPKGAHCCIGKSAPKARMLKAAWVHDQRGGSSTAASATFTM